MRFRLIDEEKSCHSISRLARVLGVTAAGYHAWRKRPPCARRLADARLKERIACHFAASQGTYGSPRLLDDLADEGIRVSRKRIARLMGEMGIAGVSGREGRRRRRKATAPESAPARDLVRRDFTAGEPNQLWFADITYVPTWEGWLFLAVVIDLFSRKVIGWSMRPDMQRDLVIDALEMAWFQRCPDKKAELIFHSDRGSQYASDDFNKLLKRCGITPSMSRKGDCWDNACSETLFGSLKVERLHGQRFGTIREAKDETLAWLLWYNQTRMHSTLNYVSPAQFEQDWEGATREIAA